MSNHAAYLHVADKLACQLVRDAIWAQHRCNWLGWSMELDQGNWVPAYRSFAYDLYSGTSGIALFLAELYPHTGDNLQKKTAFAAINQALSIYQNSGTINPSFYAGAAGLAYTLWRSAFLCDHFPWLAKAKEIMLQILRADISPGSLDVISGSAGLIPWLLRAAHEFGTAEYIEHAIKHADSLIAQAVHYEYGWAWDTMQIAGQAPLTGHSHGVAGIVTALLEVFKQTEDKRYLDAAQQGLRYERHFYSQTYQNWPDLRLGGQAESQADTYNLAWCHGAPGIGLSRWRNNQILPNDHEIQNELENALQTTMRNLSLPWNTQVGNYSLCHGAAGNAELLLLAGQSLQRQDCLDIAEKVAYEGWHFYSQSNSPWPCGVAGCGETPNLMLGLAGIGLFYLRMAKPDTVPSALLIPGGI